jgi:hypothetical protein
MSFLTVNHNDAGNNKNNGEFLPIEEGVYEVIIKEAEVTKSKSGNDMIKITLVIRDDVKQPFAKRKLWDYLVDTDKAKFKFNVLAKALNIPDGAKISTIAEFAKGILYASVRIEIKHEEEEYNGETKTRERIVKYLPTQQERSNGESNPFANAPNKPASNSTIPF